MKPKKPQELKRPRSESFSENAYNLFSEIPATITRARNSVYVSKVKNSAPVTKVTAGGRAVGKFLFNKASLVNKKIDQNHPRLSKAKRFTKKNGSKALGFILRGIDKLLKKIGLIPKCP